MADMPPVTAAMQAPLEPQCRWVTLDGPLRDITSSDEVFQTAIPPGLHVTEETGPSRRYPQRPTLATGSSGGHRHRHRAGRRDRCD